MYSKVFIVAAVLAGAYAQHHEASSYSSISFQGGDSHNNYHHAPALVKTGYAAPAVIKSAPAIIKAPVYHAAPAVIKAPVYHAAPAVIKAPGYQAAPSHQEEYQDAHPHYSFEYGIKDEETHDIHNQHEERDGDVVKGYYSLVQPDGVTRTVHYTADHHNGFNAQVEYSGHADHPQVQKAVVTKAVVAAPVYAKVPVHHSYPHH